MFGRTDRNKTPWNAQLLVLGCCVVLPILISLYQQRNPLLAFGWIGEAYVFFILIPYTLTCVANIFYHRRFHRADFNLADQPAAAGPRHRDQRLYLLQELLPDVRAARDQLRHCRPRSGRLRLAALVLAVVFTVLGIRRTGRLSRPQGFIEDEHQPGEAARD